MIATNNPTPPLENTTFVREPGKRQELFDSIGARWGRQAEVLYRRFPELRPKEAATDPQSRREYVR